MPRRQKGSDLLTHFVGFHVTETSYENLRREAAPKGCTLPAYLRVPVEGRAGGAPQEIRLKGPDMSAQPEALSRVGCNPNQIAHALSAGREPGAPVAAAAGRTVAEFGATAARIYKLVFV